MIPDCYEPDVQEERRQKELDDLAAILPVCVLCNQRLYPGARVHIARCRVVCSHCLEELMENEDIVELE